MSKVQELIKEVFDIPNIVSSTNAISNSILTTLEELLSTGDLVGATAYMVEIKESLSLLIGAVFANTSEATLIEPAVAQTVADIKVLPITETELKVVAEAKPVVAEK